jgi:hypothetical protein
VVLLDQPGEDFTGGEFIMTEQRPRMQTRAMVLPLNKGDAAIFAVNSRPMKGMRGDYPLLPLSFPEIISGHTDDVAQLERELRRRCQSVGSAV